MFSCKVNNEITGIIEMHLLGKCNMHIGTPNATIAQNLHNMEKLNIYNKMSSPSPEVSSN